MCNLGDESGLADTSGVHGEARLARVDDTFASDALNISSAFNSSAILSAVGLVSEVDAATAGFDVISNINTVETTTAVEKGTSLEALSAASIAPSDMWGLGDGDSRTIGVRTLVTVLLAFGAGLERVASFAVANRLSGFVTSTLSNGAGLAFGLSPLVLVEATAAVAARSRSPCAGELSGWALPALVLGTRVGHVETRGALLGTSVSLARAPSTSGTGRAGRGFSLGVFALATLVLPGGAGGLVGLVTSLNCLAFFLKMRTVALVVTVGARLALVVLVVVDFFASVVLTFSTFRAGCGNEGNGEYGRKKEEYEELVHCVG